VVASKAIAVLRIVLLLPLLLLEYKKVGTI
jgi:hypothetical protein